jgi:peroxiredoxin
MKFTGIITILLFLSLAFWDAGYASTKKSSLAPDFTLNDICGKQVTLSQFRGKIVVLNFWSIWCGPCLSEMPSLNKLYLEFKDKGLVVIGIAEDPAEKPVRSYIQEKGLAFPVLMDKERKVYFKYSLFGIPVTFLIDKKGVSVEKFIGERDWSSPQMKEKILKLLKKQP